MRFAVGFSVRSARSHPRRGGAASELQYPFQRWREKGADQLQIGFDVLPRAALFEAILARLSIADRGLFVVVPSQIPPSKRRLRLEGLLRESTATEISVAQGNEKAFRNSLPRKALRRSGREDSNLRPPAPKAGALPGCATPRISCGPKSLHVKTLREDLYRWKPNPFSFAENYHERPTAHSIRTCRQILGGGTEGQEICKVENGNPWGCLGRRREE